MIVPSPMLTPMPPANSSSSDASSAQQPPASQRLSWSGLQSMSGAGADSTSVTAVAGASHNGQGIATSGVLANAMPQFGSATVWSSTTSESTRSESSSGRFRGSSLQAKGSKVSADLLSPNQQLPQLPSFIQDSHLRKKSSSERESTDNQRMSHLRVESADSQPSSGRQWLDSVEYAAVATPTSATSATSGDVPPLGSIDEDSHQRHQQRGGNGTDDGGDDMDGFSDSSTTHTAENVRCTRPRSMDGDPASSDVHVTSPLHPSRKREQQRTRQFSAVALSPHVPDAASSGTAKPGGRLMRLRILGTSLTAPMAPSQLGAPSASVPEDQPTISSASAATSAAEHPAPPLRGAPSVPRRVSVAISVPTSNSAPIASGVGDVSVPPTAATVSSPRGVASAAPQPPSTVASQAQPQWIRLRVVTTAPSNTSAPAFSRTSTRDSGGSPLLSPKAAVGTPGRIVFRFNADDAPLSNHQPPSTTSTSGFRDFIFGTSAGSCIAADDSSLVSPAAADTAAGCNPPAYTPSRRVSLASMVSVGQGSVCAQPTSSTTTTVVTDSVAHQPPSFTARRLQLQLSHASVGSVLQDCLDSADTPSASTPCDTVRSGAAVAVTPRGGRRGDRGQVVFPVVMRLTGATGHSAASSVGDAYATNDSSVSVDTMPDLMLEPSAERKSVIGITGRSASRSVPATPRHLRVQAHHSNAHGGIVAHPTVNAQDSGFFDAEMFIEEMMIPIHAPTFAAGMLSATPTYGDDATLAVLEFVDDESDAAKGFLQGKTDASSDGGDGTVLWFREEDFPETHDAPVEGPTQGNREVGEEDGKQQVEDNVAQEDTEMVAVDDIAGVRGAKPNLQNTPKDLRSPQGTTVAVIVDGVF